MPQPDFYTLPELATRWKISIPTLRRWMSRGDFHGVRIGRQVRIERAEVERIEATWKAGLHNTPD